MSEDKCLCGEYV